MLPSKNDRMSIGPVHPDFNCVRHSDCAIDVVRTSPSWRPTAKRTLPSLFSGNARPSQIARSAPNISIHRLHQQLNPPRFPGSSQRAGMSTAQHNYSWKEVRHARYCDTRGTCCRFRQRHFAKVIRDNSRPTSITDLRDGSSTPTGARIASLRISSWAKALDPDRANHLNRRSDLTFRCSTSGVDGIVLQSAFP